MPTMPPSSYEDGTERSQLDLTGRQLDGSTVMYLPRSERVNFRLEVYRGGQSSSDSTRFLAAAGDPNRRRQGPARAIVEQARPSPFEHTTPEIVVTQTRPSARAAGLRDGDDTGAGGAGTTQRKPAGQVHQ